MHPFVEKNPTDKDAYMVILADYVTTEDGTGLVHTAPGHGVEDYVSGQKYDLAVYSPVMDDGRYDDTVPEWLRGKSVLEVEKRSMTISGNTAGFSPKIRLHTAIRTAGGAKAR